MTYPIQAQTPNHNQGHTDPSSQTQTQDQDENSRQSRQQHPEMDQIAKEHVYRAIRESYKTQPQEHRGLYTVANEALHSAYSPAHKTPSPFDVDDDEISGDKAKPSPNVGYSNKASSPNMSTQKHGGALPSKPNDNVSSIPTSAASSAQQQQYQKATGRHPQIATTQGANGGSSNRYNSTPSFATQRPGEVPQLQGKAATSSGESRTLRRNDTYLSENLDDPPAPTQLTNGNDSVSPVPNKKFQPLMKGSSGSYGSGSIDTFEGSGIARSTLGGQTRLVRRAQGQHSSGPIEATNEDNQTLRTQDDDGHQAYDDFGKRLGEKRKWSDAANGSANKHHRQDDEEFDNQDRSDNTLFENNGHDNSEYHDDDRHHDISKDGAEGENIHKLQNEQELKGDGDSAEEFDPMAEIIKFDAQSELVSHWRGYTGIVSPFLMNFAQNTLCSAYDTILSVTRIYHSLCTDDKRDLEEGVELINAEEDKHEEYRRVITNFSNEMKRAADMLSRFNGPKGSLPGMHQE